MIIYGEGGTGKSKVIQTVTEEFDRQGARALLVKAAYTGIAASLIDGKTTHVIASISIKDANNVSPEAIAKLQSFWRQVQYLIVDEFSMLSKTFLALLSRNVDIGKQETRTQPGGSCFGGINVILAKPVERLAEYEGWARDLRAVQDCRHPEEADACHRSWIHWTHSYCSRDSRTSTSRKIQHGRRHHWSLLDMRRE